MRMTTRLIYIMNDGYTFMVLSTGSPIKLCKGKIYTFKVKNVFFRLMNWLTAWNVPVSLNQSSLFSALFSDPLVNLEHHHLDVKQRL